MRPLRAFFGWNSSSDELELEGLREMPKYILSIVVSTAFIREGRVDRRVDCTPSVPWRARDESREGNVFVPIGSQQYSQSSLTSPIFAHPTGARSSRGCTYRMRGFVFGGNDTCAIVGVASGMPEQPKRAEVVSERYGGIASWATKKRRSLSRRQRLEQPRQ